MGKIRELCTSGSGVSSMRVMSFIALGFGGMIAVVGLAMRVNLTELSLLSGVFVGAAFGGKVGQKFAEVRRDSPATGDRSDLG
jgi:hypothetical protein